MLNYHTEPHKPERKEDIGAEAAALARASSAADPAATGTKVQKDKQKMRKIKEQVIRLTRSDQ